MKYIDDFLNGITMYRLLLYYLIILAAIGGVFSAMGILRFGLINYFLTAALIVAVSYISNKVFSYVYEAPTNVESVYITALILILIVPPIAQFHDFIAVGWVATLATASKYILAIGKKHIFNPAAIAVLLTAVAIDYSPVWWVGSASMLPFVIIGGLLIARKIKRFDLVLSFVAVALVTISAASVARGSELIATLAHSINDTPLIFFATVMLTEPLTTPPVRNLRIIYGSIVGFLFAPQLHLGSLYTTPEMALVIGNIFSFIVSPKQKLMLTLKEKVQLAPNIFDFVFTPNITPAFAPGQYMEWTLPHENTDSRGNRRYFTLASSPTEKDIRIGVKFNNPSSSYKKSLLDLDNRTIVASQIAGDFTLEPNSTEKLVFIAGGIGITPYRSITKYLVDKGQKRDIVLFYAAATAADFVYKDVFTEAAQKIGLRTVYVASETQGHITEDMIKKEVPDYKDRMFYLSGPHGMIEAFEHTLSKMGVRKIKTDFFPGYA